MTSADFLMKQTRVQWTNSENEIMDENGVTHMNAENKKMLLRMEFH